jgi:hypothetical protein
MAEVRSAVEADSLISQPPAALICAQSDPGLLTADSVLQVGETTQRRAVGSIYPDVRVVRRGAVDLYGVSPPGLGGRRSQI